MNQEDDKYKDVNDLLNRLFNEESRTSYHALKELFEQRLAHLDITKNQALKILSLDYKQLDAVLNGEAKKIDFVSILKLSGFLEISQEELLNKYFTLIKETYNESISVARKRSFLVNHFNLPSLKKIGLIDSINDYEHIEERIKKFLGYEDIFEHEKHVVTAAFSSAKRETNKENLSLWYAAARQSLEMTPNPHEYDREKLKKFFPEIRWHSMDVACGLYNVGQALFKLGITLIIMPKFTPDLHFRGATLSYRSKPCIVLTNYTKFYATLWFSLIHELFHVLYDWEEIFAENYHISGTTESIKINEQEADNFARQYLFSDEKMDFIKPNINDHSYVKHFAKRNHIDPSIIYTFYCWDKADDKIYRKFDKYMPELDLLFEPFGVKSFSALKPVKEISKERNVKLSYI